MNYQQTPAARAASAANADGDQHQASPRSTSSHAGRSQILRPYQETAVNDIEAALDEGDKVLYVLPTGGGKTVVLVKIIERAVHIGKRVLILTHRREILRQTSLKMAVEHGLIQAGLNVDLTYPVQIASVQTLWARCMRTDKVPLPAADVIIIDEAHHIAAPTWRMILDAYPNARRVGLTATPCRSDGRGLGNYFTTIVEGPQIPELIKEKHLVPTIYYAPADPDLKGVETRQGDYVVNQLADRMNRDDLVGDIVSNWHKYGQRRKTLVFCVDVAHSVHVKNEFVKSGIGAEHLDGGTPKSERDGILTRLASGKTEVVCNCMVLIRLRLAGDRLHRSCSADQTNRFVQANGRARPTTGARQEQPRPHRSQRCGVPAWAIRGSDRVDARHRQASHESDTRNARPQRNIPAR